MNNGLLPVKSPGDGVDLTGEFVGVRAREPRADPACPVSTSRTGLASVSVRAPPPLQAALRTIDRHVHAYVDQVRLRDSV
jgi:hypothetical protein